MWKEDLLLDTTFDTCQLSMESTFKLEKGVYSRRSKYNHRGNYNHCTLLRRSQCVKKKFRLFLFLQ